MRPEIDDDARIAIAELGGLESIRWIDASQRMPKLYYNPKARYWYSERVLTKNDHAIEVQVSMSHDGNGGSFPRPVGGRPTHWAHLL